MPIEFWTGRPESPFQHEMEARLKLIDQLGQTFGGSQGLVAAVFDFSCGADLDLAIFKTDGITVVELKECARPIEAAENGEWQMMHPVGQERSLKGGKYGNPFQQVKAYRFELIKFLGDHCSEFLPAQKAAQVRFGHVSAVVAISPILHPESRLHFDFGRLRWFSVVGLPELPSRLYTIRSTEISLTDGEIRRLVEKVLRCSPLRPQKGMAAEGPVGVREPTSKQIPRTSVSPGPGRINVKGPITEQIFCTAAALVRDGMSTFARVDIRNRLEIAKDKWDNSYSPTFQGMREDTSPHAPNVADKFKNVFRLVSHGKYTLSDYGLELMNQIVCE
jgi:hypothetical protein